MSAFFLQHPKETDLALFAGGESGPFARWRIERHVERCAECKAVASDYFRLPEQLESLAELPEVDWDGLSRAINAGVRGDRAAASPEAFWSSPRLWLGAGAVAAAATAAVVTTQVPDTPAVDAQPKVVAQAAEPALVDAASVEAALESRVVESAVREEALEVEMPTVTDVAAPAPPPPPPLLKAAAESAPPVADALTPAAESSAARLRDDAAARVGAVSALGGGARDVPIEWVQYPVVAENEDGAPVQLISGYAEAAGEAIRTPAMALVNRSDQTVTAFTLVWVVEEQGTQRMTLVRRDGVSVESGSTLPTAGGMLWRRSAGAPGPMRAYPLSVTFEDGSSWASPRSDETAPAAGLERFVPITGR